MLRHVSFWTRKTHVWQERFALAVGQGGRPRRLALERENLSILREKDTIFALASGQGKSGIAVVRLSGDHVADVYRRLTRLSSLPNIREATLCKLYCPKSHVLLDHALALYFRGPKSFTGEDVLELHVHGGRAVVQSVLGALGTLPECRSAEPGEFTRRAFFQGKMDLTQVEGLDDLIHADTEMQRRQAIHHMQGTQQLRYKSWRETLVHQLAFTEAYIDFHEDDAIETDTVVNVRKALQTLYSDIDHFLNDQGRGEILREGIRISLFGPPNAGKSSLLNCLAKRDVAIVSPIAGTTRDIIQIHLDFKGFPLVVSDTAGLRSTSQDAIELEGMRRTRASIKQADIKLLILDARQIDDLHSQTDLDKNTIVVVNKSDLICRQEEKMEIVKKIDAVRRMLRDVAPGPFTISQNVIFVSCLEDGGLEMLYKELLSFLTETYKDNSNVGVIAHARHRELLSEVVALIKDALQLMDEEVVLAAECMRSAAISLGKLTGKIYVEELLDVVFKNFCIGK